ncbi:hypothetical protein QL285_043448 [Trifolium repens]|nr:hypothetical protein QL285_043448 [Trifolium repens]
MLNGVSGAMVKDMFWTGPRAGQILFCSTYGARTPPRHMDLRAPPRHMELRAPPRHREFGTPARHMELRACNAPNRFACNN